MKQFIFDSNKVFFKILPGVFLRFPPKLKGYLEKKCFHRKATITLLTTTEPTRSLCSLAALNHFCLDVNTLHIYFTHTLPVSTHTQKSGEEDKYIGFESHILFYCSNMAGQYIQHSTYSTSAHSDVHEDKHRRQICRDVHTHTQSSELP